MKGDHPSKSRKGVYGAFLERLNERIPDEMLVDQLERELSVGGDEPDLRQMAIRQRARQDIEAHKGYRRHERQEAGEAGGVTVRIVKFSEKGADDDA